MNHPTLDSTPRGSLLEWGGALPRILCLGVLWLAVLVLAGIGLRVGVLGLGALLPLAAADAAPDAPLAEPVTSEALQERLKQLSKLLRAQRSTDSELIEALQLVVKERARLEASPKGSASLDKKLVKVLLKATALRHPPKRHTVVGAVPDGAHRDDVNVAAAELLADVGADMEGKAQRSLSRRIRDELDAWRKKYDPEEWRTRGIEAMFMTLARLGDPDSLQWILDEHVHTKSRELVFLIAAQKSLTAYQDVPGRVRLEVFIDFLKTYRGVEALALRNNGSPDDRSKKMLWDALREYTIPVFQHFAGAPRNENDEALSTVLEFLRWYSDHKKPRRAPWVD